MRTAMSTGLRVATWSTAGLLAMGTAATTASAVAGHHGDGDKSGSGQGSGGPGRGDSGSGDRGHDDDFGNIVHGTSTVKIKKKFVTFAQQQGTIDDINTEAVTVTSADEFAATYVVGTHTKAFDKGRRVAVSKLADGDDVSVLAKQVGGQLTAVTISEGQPRHHDGDHDGDGDGDHNGDGDGDHDGGGDNDG